MARHGVRNVFLPPTALKLMRQAGARPAAPGLRLRSVGSGGETLGGELLDWGRATLRPDDQRVLRPDRVQPGRRATAPALMPVRPGSMGRAGAGPRRRRRRRRRARALPPGEAGPDRRPPARPGDVPRLLEQPEATAEKFAGDWLLTGDSGARGRGRLPLVRRPRATTSSPAPATASARPRSRTACCATRPSRWPPWSACPTRAAHRGRQGVRRAAAGAVPLAGRSPGEIQDVRQGAARRARVPARDRVRRRAADDRDRQDHPPRAAGARDGEGPRGMRRGRRYRRRPNGTFRLVPPQLVSCRPLPHEEY